MRASSALIARFERAGFQLVRKNGHCVWRCPCGHRQVTSPATPGRGRSVQNTEAEIARTLRICKTKEYA